MSDYVNAEIIVDVLDRFCDDNASKAEVEKEVIRYLNIEKKDMRENEYLYNKAIEVLFSREEINILKLYYVLSALLQLTDNEKLLCELADLVAKDENLQKENKYYLYCRMALYRFIHPTVNTLVVNEALDDLYDTIYQMYRTEVKDLCIRIPRDERNKEFVVVLTSQVLSLNHGPTKTLLDRCYVLQKEMNKKVYIINTADTVPDYGEMDWCCDYSGNYIDEFTDREYLEYKDEKFLFLQCPKEMPNISIIRSIMEMIRDEKPYYIVSIGGENITADLCSCIVPTITITLGPSERTQTRTTFQMTGHIIDENDKKWLLKHGFTEEHIIEGVFTSNFKAQEHVYSRDYLGLNETGIICLVVGARLDMEIDDDFIWVVKELAQKGIYTAFAGVFDKYDSIVKDDPLMKEYTVSLGFQEDMLAICECCDIYINPKRLGGGTSGAEALSKGLPVVTINYGDVAIGAGRDFCVASYDSMIKTVTKMANDKGYYSEMHKKALERAAVLMDSRSEFKRILKEMENRSTFF